MTLLLTPDERFRFDVNGFIKLERALSPEALCAVNAKLDDFEQLGLRFQQRNPDIEDERIPVVEGKQVELHLQNWGQKIWIFDMLSEEPALAAPLAGNPAIRKWIEEMVPAPVLGLFSARFQWKGAESHIHGSRDNISEPPPGGGPEAGGNYYVERDGGVPRVRTSAFRVMYMLSDIKPGGGALRVIPGSHKREVPWQPAGVRLRPAGNTRFDELSPAQQSNFVELTGRAGTAVIFTHDIIHCSWHATDTYRRVVHCTFGTGKTGTFRPLLEPCPFLCVRGVGYQQW